MPKPKRKKASGPPKTKGHAGATLAFTKLDAVFAQMETALGLWFSEEDPVSTHTLACACYDILSDLNDDAKGAPMIREDPHIRPDKREEWYAMFVSAQNFFKHADKDPHDTFLLNPDSTKFPLFDAVLKYHELSKARPSHLATTFLTYMVIHRLSFFNEKQVNLMCDGLPVNQLSKVSRKEFLRYFSTR